MLLNLVLMIVLVGLIIYSIYFAFNKIWVSMKLQHVVITCASKH